jgi:hypothetical protein
VVKCFHAAPKRTPARPIHSIHSPPLDAEGIFMICSHFAHRGMINGAAYRNHVLGQAGRGLAGSEGLPAQGSDAAGLVWGAKELSPCRRVPSLWENSAGIESSRSCVAAGSPPTGAPMRSVRPKILMQPVETIRYRESLFDGVSFAGPRCAGEAKGAAEEA